MDLLTNRKAVLSFVGAVVVVAIPVMADHKPGEVADAFKRWLPAFYVLAGFLVLYAVAAFAFAQGRASKELKGELPIVIAPAKGRSIKDLIYAANQIASILLEQGALRVGEWKPAIPRWSVTTTSGMMTRRGLHETILWRSPAIAAICAS
ncbi:hypothetical protein U5A82_06190 [Sphingobium sp. CR2-8]|uniref:hypothetical protein n=1 Tax=Sphingobium sp. CR2-8 TaxID=1306534 RepID=UPI002DB819CA|nr:hypothetical protein [Sphingobium sp. CR2-8]MEC3910078.1 hypothetical protein [Sphingobium sp. CR2-8]